MEHDGIVFFPARWESLDLKKMRAPEEKGLHLDPNREDVRENARKNVK